MDMVIIKELFLETERGHLNPTNCVDGQIHSIKFT